MNTVIWSGLADANYYEYIAKFCLHSWTTLPGEKYVVHDGNIIDIPDLIIKDWNHVQNVDCNFLKFKPKKKTWNFWRKMQSQVWAIRNLVNCDFLVLLDTDIEILEFNQLIFDQELTNFKESNLIWATGQSTRGGHDSGFIILNMNHPHLPELTNFYENIWESGEIFNLEKSYDGHAVESMFQLYPSYKIKNKDHGSGLHVYELGMVHWGSKLPKEHRINWTGDGKSLLNTLLPNNWK